MAMLMEMEISKVFLCIAPADTLTEIQKEDSQVHSLL